MISLLIHWVLAALGFLIASYIVPGFQVQSFGIALLAALVVGLLNILVWPVLVFFTLPLTLITFGLFLFVLNALILLLGASITPGFEILGFWPAIFGSILLTLVGWVARFVF